MEEFRDHRTISCTERIYAFPTKFIMGFFQKKRGDDLEIVASTNEGGWDWRVISFLNDSKGEKPLKSI